MPSQVIAPLAELPASAPTRRTANLLPLLFLLSGFALRLFNLGAESLWYDETVSAYLASEPLIDLIAHTARDIHPPAYYLLLHVWRIIAHPTVAFGLEFLYGWPSVVLSVLIMALTYAIAKRCFGLNAALWALAVATIQPTQIWSAQEVRMYALGGLALMLTLWAVSPLFIDAPKQDRSVAASSPNLALYALAALLGLYTLYYFLFWLVILNLCIFVRVWKQRKLLLTWILLQLIVLVGWLPWLPTFFRQATNPPVPPWRVPWQTLTEIVSAKVEALAAVWVGHIAPLAIFWPWATLTVITAIAFYVYAKNIQRGTRILWLALCFGPIALLLAVSIIGPPIYHVRYIATYAPLFAIVLGVLLASIPRFATGVVAIVFVAVSALSLYQFWTDPRYAADDHRSAVATLAAEWRPGDAILVNAGWVYTALSVYWPTELPVPNATRPPAIEDIVRLDSLNTFTPISGTLPVIYRTGSIDGDSNLGWGLPESDFFAVSHEDTTEALAQLATTHARIWHYRLYDTVNDPTGVIRQWLGENTSQEFSLSIPGRDFLLLERYRSNVASAPIAQADSIMFPDVGATLLDSNHVATLPAGEMLFVNLLWDAAAPDVIAQPPAISLRLYDEQGKMLLQKDSPFVADSSRPITQSLALAIPADTIPSNYQVAALLYAPDTLQAYIATTAGGNQVTNPIPLGEVTIQLPKIIPHTGTPIATFDYIDLLIADLPTTPVAPGGSLPPAWTWRPQSSEYKDQYVAHLELSDGKELPIVLADFNLGGDAYLSSTWPALYPLRQRVSMQLPDDLSPGNYQVHLSLSRASDAQQIPARQPGSINNKPFVIVGELTVETTGN